MPSNNITEDRLPKKKATKLRPLEENIADLVKTVEFISAKRYDELLTNQKNLEAVNDGLLKEKSKMKFLMI